MRQKILQLESPEQLNGARSGTHLLILNIAHVQNLCTPDKCLKEVCLSWAVTNNRCRRKRAYHAINTSA
jgi:hypothetical protein